MRVATMERCAERLGRSLALAILGIGVGLFAGCAQTENLFVDNSPSRTMEIDSPSAADAYARFQPAEQRQRSWARMSTAAERGAVDHGPLYFEDPFEDKGSGHGDYRIGWEDAIAVPYNLARFTTNWLLLEVSLVVTPPWTPMESDGNLSRQLLGYDHDAEPINGLWFAPHACESKPSDEAARDQGPDPTPKKAGPPPTESMPESKSAPA